MEAILGTVATTVAPKLIEMGTNAVTSAFSGSEENTNMEGCSAGMQAEASESAISDMHAPPVDVRLAAQPVPMVSQEKPYRTNNAMIKRERVAIEPVRKGLGTNRYDLFEESATRIIKTRVNYSPETYTGYVDSIYGALNMQNTGTPWKSYKASSAGTLVTLAIDGTEQVYTNGAYYVSHLIGKESLLVDGEYEAEALIYSESELIITARHFIKYKVASKKYTQVLIMGAITSLKTIYDDDFLTLRFAPVGPLQHETGNYLAAGTTDIFNYLSGVEDEAFATYEAYSIKSFRIDLEWAP